jgi:hypothetical protein
MPSTRSDRSPGADPGTTDVPMEDSRMVVGLSVARVLGRRVATTVNGLAILARGEIGQHAFELLVQANLRVTM